MVRLGTCIISYLCVIYILITTLYLCRCEAASTDHNSATLSGPWTRYHSPSSTYLFTARRKPTSHSWSVPESDIDLLKGVGANGNDLRKGDDGFEIMLLMDMIDLDGVWCVLVSHSVNLKLKNSNFNWRCMSKQTNSGNQGRIPRLLMIPFQLLKTYEPNSWLSDTADSSVFDCSKRVSRNWEAVAGDVNWCNSIAS